MNPPPETFTAACSSSLRSAWRLLSAGLLSICVLSSCGGAESDGSGGSSAPLSGRLLFPYPEFEDAWYLDLSTGHYSPVPNLVWGDDENTLCNDFALFSVAPVRGSDRLLESRINCQYTEASEVYGQYSQFALWSGAGEYIDGFVTLLLSGDFLYGPARLSPDSRHVVIRGAYDGDPGMYHLQLFSFVGEWLAVSNENRVFDGNFAWLPDNRLIYASEQTIYIAPSGSVAGEPWMTFDDTDGEPSQLSLSPDGRQLAFTLVSDRSSTVAIFGEIWIVDLQTQARRRLVYALEPDQLNFPIWSPDGRWIGFIQNVPSTANYLARAHYFIVPSDSENIQVTQDGISEGIQLRTWITDVTPGSPEYSTRFLRTAPIGWLP